MDSLRQINHPLAIKTLTKAILIAIGTGTVIAMALMAPNAIQILKPFLGKGKRKDHDTKRIRQALAALKRRRLIAYTEKNGEMILRVTQQGKTHLRKFAIETMALPRGSWDRRWRIIIFDIPEERGGARRAFQQQLRSLGAMRLQKSVFVYPHECLDEIDALTSFWDIPRFVHYLRANDLGRAEGSARKFFRLL